MLEHGIDICVIEDDEAQRRMLVRKLKSQKFSVVEAGDGPSGLQCIYQHRPRVVISDVVMSELNGIQLCRHLRADPSLDGTYVILVSAHHDDGRKARVLNAGADDYVAKPYDFEELRARIRNGLRYHRLQQRLQLAAQTDGLTGLWNHAQFCRTLEHEFNRTRRYGGGVSVLMLDLDHFKAINDTYGHEAGNEILRLTARTLQECVREADYVSRYGGEEFAIICPETSLDDAYALAERIRKALPDRVRAASFARIAARVSIGVASTEDPRANSVDALINLSDQALYFSKRNGRDRVTRCNELGDVVAPPETSRDEIDRLQKEVVALSMRTKDIVLQSIWALIQALEARDGYSAWHSRNVTMYTKLLVEAAGWSSSLRHAAANAAMLHDLGKIGVPDGLLLKPRPLDPQEAAVLRQVPLLTCRILEPLRVFETEIQMIRHIRESFDGSGYPDGLVGESIPIGSRVIAIAEAFDSLTCNRAYRAGRSIDEALEAISAQAGLQFDPRFTTLLEETVKAQRQQWQEHVDRARAPEPQLEIHSLLD